MRWVDVNKGDDEDPNYRNRLGAKHFQWRGDDSIFESTPLSKALRPILMLAATPFLFALAWICIDGGHRMQISLVGISRAYFHARVEGSNRLYVELIPEDED